MVISDKYRTIFIHIPKTGGTSIRFSLYEMDDACRDGSEWFTSNPAFRAHLTAQQIFDRIPDWYKYKSFAIVRNPWDRLVSVWAYLTKGSISFSDFVLNPPSYAQQYLRPQTDYVLATDNHSPLPTYVGRYENLKRDFARITKSKAILPHVQISTHLPYQYYYTPNLVQYVADKYAHDITMFGYHFGSNESGN